MAMLALCRNMNMQHAEVGLKPMASAAANNNYRESWTQPVLERWFCLPVYIGIVE